MSTGATRQYLCNQCGHIVTSAPQPSTSALICANCTSTFLEPFQNPNPTDKSIESDQLGLSDDISGAGNSAADGANGFWSPPELLLDYVVMFLTGIEYGINRIGSPPASKAVVEALSSVTMSEEMVESGVSQCVICKESFCVGDVAKELPCKHVYHCDCILPWLGIRNWCPLCRFKLTDDVVNESRRREASSGEGSNSRDGNSGHGNGNAGSSNEDID